MIGRSENRGAWLFGPASDLLWGSGVAYVALFALLVYDGPGVSSILPPWLTMFLVVLVSMPHYGATLLRVYEGAEDRKAHARFATSTAVALGLLFLWGVRDPWVGSILFTLYFTWSPWHYTAQNYGIALMFLGRRGIELPPRERFLLRASFWLSFAVTILFIHGPYTFVPFRGTQVQFLSLNLPALPADVGLLAALLGYAASSIGLVAMLLARGGRRMAPALVLMATQSIWFVLPAVMKNWLPYSGFPLFDAGYENYAFTWIALAHAAQYLWITAYFAKASGRSATVSSFYFKTLMAGCAVWAIPLLLFAPGMLGKLPYDLGLASVTAAVVNLHHFILDGAIWKLRKAPVRRILLSREKGSVEDSGAPRRLWWPLVATGLASVAMLLFGTVEEEFGLARSLNRLDTRRADVAMERLAAVGRDSPNGRLQVAALALKTGDPETALHHLESGVRVFPTVAGWIRLGQTRSRLDDSSGAVEAFENALTMEPDNDTAKMSLALAWVQAGEKERARLLIDQRPGRETIESRRLRQQVKGLLGS